MTKLVLVLLSVALVWFFVCAELRYTETTYTIDADAINTVYKVSAIAHVDDPPGALMYRYKKGSDGIYRTDGVRRAYNLDVRIGFSRYKMKTSQGLLDVDESKLKIEN